MNQLVPKRQVSDLEKKASLEKAIYDLSISGDFSYISFILQSLNIRYDNRNCPTIGIGYDKLKRRLELIINAEFFTSVTPAERVALLKHEIMHVLNKHVFYMHSYQVEERSIVNVAMDLVINQFIKNLPKNGIFLKDFKTKDGKDFPPNRTLEDYYDLIKDDAKFEPEPSDDGKGGKEPQQSHLAKEYFKGKPDGAFDIHGWDKSGADPKEIMDATGELVQRALIKASHGHSTDTRALEDFLEVIKAHIKKIDYKAILLSTLKKSLPSKIYRLTWKKPNRRYGEDAKGKVNGLLPKIQVFVDTSGSISVEEANEFLSIANNFLTIGVDSAQIDFFHTSIYHTEKVKKNFKIEPNKFQSGGTDLTECFNKLTKTKYDLAIFLTDGYYSRPDVNYNKIGCNTVFIISKGGTVNHPLKDIGKTVPYVS